MLLVELKLKENEKIKMMVDSKSDIDLSKHPVAHGRSKHIETRFHFLRDQVNKGKLEIMHCKTEDQVVDLLTKPLKISSFEYLRNRLGMSKTSN
uniref:Polynucleotidyl transferase, Ribonuclease H fold n=1 Tax=Medicago truncatula TaxID=3880 RepID=A2Q1C9_MEDTR|nr:Polynucleotidyl transferase, Ribonuclease H fold [Medicago truncatula]